MTTAVKEPVVKAPAVKSFSDIKFSDIKFSDMHFHQIKTAVAKQFQKMVSYPLFFTAATGDEVWDTYLASFPEGSNPMFRERTEHDCTACRHFVKSVGNVAAIIDGEVVSIWDTVVGEPNYQVVVSKLAAFVKSKPIENIFLSVERTAGVDKTFEGSIAEITTWEHFFVNIPKKFVRNFTLIGPELSEARARHDVLLRSLREIKPAAIATVLDLIEQNSIDRGSENKQVVIAFKKLSDFFNESIVNLPINAQSNFAWFESAIGSAIVSKIRSAAIGTLLVDLSEGADIDDAVNSYAFKVSGANYRRTTAVSTPRMIESAKKTVEELGLTSALSRRYATVDDISVTDLLFADRSIKPELLKNIFDTLAGSVKVSKPKKMDKIEEISIDDFLTKVVPSADSIEVFVENSHTKNLVSLIAPVDPTAGNLFKWPNNFSWAYNGDVAYSLKERVKKAGGSVTGDLCCRLAWNNYDDLDLHMVEPGGYEIYFNTKHRISPCGGRLDVDMNAGGGHTRSSVENIYYSTASKMIEGIYTLKVNNFQMREHIDTGFEVEIEFQGVPCIFTYDKPVNNGETIIVARFSYRKIDGIKLIKSIPMNTSSSKVVWGIPTESFNKVKAISLSPNYWGDSKPGNKHYFFMIEGAKNMGEDGTGTARGFFNEFLKPELHAHSKVFELLGSQLKVEASENQFSGLGFSSTQRDSLLVKVTGSFTRMLQVKF